MYNQLTWVRWFMIEPITPPAAATVPTQTHQSHLKESLLMRSSEVMVWWATAPDSTDAA